MKWMRRLVLLAPAAYSLVLAWRSWPDPFYVTLTLALAGAALWAWTARQRLREVESV